MVPTTYDWLLWLDDDDTSPAPRTSAARRDRAPDVDGFVFFYDYARDEHGNCVCELWRERLIRRDAGYTWKGAVHEVLDPARRAAAELVQVPREHVRYVHNRPPTGTTRPEPQDPARRQRQRRGEGEPVDPRTLAYIGTEYMAQQAVRRGRRLPAGVPRSTRRRLVGRADAGAPQARDVPARCSATRTAAVEVEMQALRERDDWAETAVGLAERSRSSASGTACERWAKRALELGMPQSPLILNPLEFTLRAARQARGGVHAPGRFDEARASSSRPRGIPPSARARRRPRSSGARTRARAAR
jgi:hypothetical protein